MPLWLTEHDVRAALHPAALIDAMQSALADLSAGRVVHPVRTAFEIAPRSFFAVMPAFAAYRGILGAKLLSVVPANAARGLDTHLAAIALFHAETGELLSIMDGRYITEQRTAAVSAVSVRHLARPGAATLAILGSSVQARSHLHALSLVMPFHDVRVWSPTPAKLQQFVAEAAPRYPVRAAAGPRQAVEGADVVLVATNSPTPAISNEWVSPGAHVIAIGACRPSQREVDSALVARSRLIVDSRAAALQESGDVLLGIQEGFFGPDHIAAELGDVVSGARPGRENAAQVTVFKSLGLAIEDLVSAHLAYHRARELGLGLSLSLSS